MEVPDLGRYETLSHLHLLQEREDLEGELARADEGTDIAPLEKRFVKVAKSYGERKGITYSTWRQSGVGADGLKKAGIARTKE